MDGQLVAMSSTKPWKKLEIPGNIFKNLNDQNRPVFDTLDISNYEYSVRVIYGSISPTEILQIGLSLEDKEEYLKIFRDLLFLLMIPLFILMNIG